MAFNIPSRHRGLVFESVSKDLSGLQIQSLPTPQVEAGSAIVRVLGASVLSYQRDIYDGERDYFLPKPLIGGFSAIGRVVAVGSDAIALQPGNLVYLDSVIRGRDDLNAVILSGVSDGFNERGKKLMKDVWRNGTFAEYTKFPLENCILLNEPKLCQGLGYDILDLIYISYLLVSYGGLRDIKVEPGETVLVCPATGGFGGAGVQVAIAMGANTIAMGRDEQELARLKTNVTEGTPGANIETVKMTGDEEKDLNALLAFGTIDAVLDLSPPTASKSPHLNSAIRAIRRKGRVSLMGGFMDGPIPSFELIAKDITVKGKFMYEREDISQFLKMLESGRFPRGKKFVNMKSFPLDEWKTALDVAAEYTGIGRSVVIIP
ncbi:HotDog domain-containing protein [Penicillium atrosanguineum]|uniref:HotDog domain-containing protein n=1 Tax=Penicillium atrosanguineum TaxID=1132637 RepID=UPI0023A1BE4B|nr:HotDog domain-containing protein [Penicillium atrosanguineum]KAJ5117907.1 NAD(P)-binding protein [Penicillium atrosanguineum]KAJ5309289.1 HotDog domain-containing protein [Penicillium atrosanguineum]